MICAPSNLKNSEAVLKAFGYWPSFHDSPVVAFHYDRRGMGAVEFTLHGWEMTSEVDERGFFKRIHHHLVRFAFRDVLEADLDRFTPENILFALKLSSAGEQPADGLFAVDLQSAMGGDLGGSFSARFGEVLEVVACDGEGRAMEAGATPKSGPVRQPANPAVQHGPPSVS